MGKRWLPLEANPEVMQKYINALGGPKNVTFVDVLACESWALDMVPKPVYALVLLYPIKDDKKETSGSADISTSGNVWFIKQTIGNACGTIGLLHSIANNLDSAPCEKGKFFDTFFTKVKDMTPAERGKALEESDEIERAHEKAEKDGQSSVPSHDERIDTHFIAFVEKEGKLIELDGRKDAPVIHKECTRDSFFHEAVQVVKEKYMAKDPTELRFSMLAMTGNQS